MILLIDIPVWLPPILGPFIGASAAIIAAIIANHYAERRFHAQLAFDEAQKVKQREAELRRDIYLEAIEGVAKLLDILSNAANETAPVGGSEATKGANGSLAKALMIGSSETCKCILETQDAFAASLFELIKKRLAIEIEDGNLKNVSAKIEELTNWRSSLATDCKAAIQGARQEDADYYLDQIRQVNEKITQANDQSIQINENLIPLRLGLYQEVVDQTAKFSSVAMEAVFQFRKELELYTDESTLRTYLVESDKRRLEIFGAFHRHISQATKDFLDS